jgi:hypothetical protein
MKDRPAAPGRVRAVDAARARLAPPPEAYSGGMGPSANFWSAFGAKAASRKPNVT